KQQTQPPAFDASAKGGRLILYIVSKPDGRSSPAGAVGHPCPDDEVRLPPQAGAAVLLGFHQKEPGGLVRGGPHQLDPLGIQPGGAQGGKDGGHLFRPLAGGQLAPALEQPGGAGGHVGGGAEVVVAGGGPAGVTAAKAPGEIG